MIGTLIGKYISHKATKITEKKNFFVLFVTLCGNAATYLTQSHKDHREKNLLCVLCVGML